MHRVTRKLISSTGTKPPVFLIRSRLSSLLSACRGTRLTSDVWISGDFSWSILNHPLIHTGHKLFKPYKWANELAIGCDVKTQMGSRNIPLFCIRNILTDFEGHRFGPLWNADKSINSLFFFCTSSLYFFCISLPHSALGVRITRLPEPHNHWIRERISARMSSLVSAWAEVVSECLSPSTVPPPSAHLLMSTLLCALHSIWLLFCCSLTARAQFPFKESKFHGRTRAISLENIRLVSASTCAKASSSAAQSQQDNSTKDGWETAAAWAVALRRRARRTRAILDCRVVENSGLRTREWL